ncbi:hypothetical protein M2427_005142 [Bradyrhizobium sp. BR13661]|nr:hypothetical protein [Bradyrhizobium sp. BR13661]
MPYGTTARRCNERNNDLSRLQRRVLARSPYRQDNPASMVVQKPQWSGARGGAPALASNRKIATVKITNADEKMTKRLRMRDAFSGHRGRTKAPAFASHELRRGKPAALSRQPLRDFLLRLRARFGIGSEMAALGN